MPKIAEMFKAARQQFSRLHVSAKVMAIVLPASGTASAVNATLFAVNHGWKGAALEGIVALGFAIFTRDLYRNRFLYSKNEKLVHG